MQKVLSSYGIPARLIVLCGLVAVLARVSAARGPALSGQHHSPAARLVAVPLYFEEAAQGGFLVQGTRPGGHLRDGGALCADGLCLHLQGSGPAKAEGVEELPGRVNYFIGRDPKSWRRGVKTYRRVRYRGIYPGVDLVYYGRQGRLEYDLLIAAGADPKVIELAVEGRGALTVDARGDLLLNQGTLRLRKPVLYQEVNGMRRQVFGGYVLRGRRRAGFHVGEYDRARPLVIDPVLVFSTYLGGSGDENVSGASDDVSTTAIALDADGNVYVAGNTTSVDFPTASPFQRAYKGNTDAFVAKLDPTGSRLLYCTYLGGSELDRAFGMAVDRTGHAYVAGRTHSSDFPTVNAFQRTLHGYEDGFLSKLSPDGQTLIYSTYLGGINNDDIIAVAVDSAGSAYVTGETQSPDFPLANPAQPRFGGRYDAFVTKFNPQGSGLVYSTFLGGTQGDDGRAITVDDAGNAYLTGYTSSTDLPMVKPLQPAFGGGREDVLLAKLDTQGSLVYCTYLGGSGTEWGLSIALDLTGNIYVTGITTSTNFPVTKDASQAAYGGGSTDAFLVKLDAAGSSMLYASYFGASGMDGSLGVGLDASGAVYIGGYTSSANLSSFPGNVQPGFGGGDADAFVAKFTPPSMSLAYFTYLGGRGLDIGMAIAVDLAGNVHLAGATDSPDFPITAKAVQRTFGGGSLDGLIVKIETAVTKLLVSVPAASCTRATGFAPESMASAYGEDLADSAVVAETTPLPTRLAGRSVIVKDSTGTIREAPLFFISRGQVNYLIPAGTALGPAVVTALRETTVPNRFTTVAEGSIEISQVAPGLFAANADGRGAAAAVVTRVSGDGAGSWQYTFRCGAQPGSCEPSSIDLGSATDQVILQLYGSGIRRRSSLQAASAKIGGVDAEVLYAGAQGSFAGLDQVNVRLPRSLAGRGEVEVLLTVDGKTANTVKVSIK